MKQTQEQRKAKRAAYYQANRDSLIATQRLYDKANRETINARQREYINREDIKARRLEYLNENRELVTASRAAHYQANRDELKAKNLEYYNSKLANRYFVYKHTNEAGDTYIGSGNARRPNDTANRDELWRAAFSEGRDVEIVKECGTRDEAYELEASLIKEIGLSNLVNTFNATCG